MGRFYFWQIGIGLNPCDIIQIEEIYLLDDAWHFEGAG